MMNNTCPPRFTAAAGTKLAGTSYLRYCHYHLLRKNFTIKYLHHSHNIAGSSKAHCPKFLTAAYIVRAVFIPIVTDHPPRPAKDHRLGRLLPLPTT